MKRPIYILAHWLYGCLALLVLWGIITITTSSPKGMAALPLEQRGWITVQGVETPTLTLTPTATATATEIPTTTTTAR